MPRTLSCADGPRCRRQPLTCRGVDQRGELGGDARVIGVEPGDLGRVEQRRIDEAAVDRGERQRTD